MARLSLQMASGSSIFRRSRIDKSPGLWTRSAVPGVEEARALADSSREWCFVLRAAARCPS